MATCPWPLAHGVDNNVMLALNCDIWTPKRFLWQVVFPFIQSWLLNHSALMPLKNMVSMVRAVCNNITTLFSPFDMMLSVI